MGRQALDDEARARKLRQLRDLVDGHAEEQWRTIEGGPTLETIASVIGLTPAGLDKAYRRYGSVWGVEKARSRQRAFSNKWVNLSVVSA